MYIKLPVDEKFEDYFQYEIGCSEPHPSVWGYLQNRRILKRFHFNINEMGFKEEDGQLYFIYDGDEYYFYMFQI